MSQRHVILIVEDQADIRSLIRMTLEMGDNEIHEAENGDSGWHMVKALRPDLVLLDVMMPGTLDGYQVCQKIRGEPAFRDLPVIMLTARGQQSDFEMGRKVGATAYLTKPFSPLELIDTVDSHLQARPCSAA